MKKTLLALTFVAATFGAFSQTKPAPATHAMPAKHIVAAKADTTKKATVVKKTHKTVSHAKKAK